MAPDKTNVINSWYDGDEIVHCAECGEPISNDRPYADVSLETEPFRALCEICTLRLVVLGIREAVGLRKTNL